ncbi:hypothetical protein GM182_07075 [bacterium 3DAC]|nr:hypothetical protein GM182_07075 [bacterium 3DAC]
MNRKAFAIKTFPPAWFAAVMGTGAVANATYLIGFPIVGRVIYYINLVMAALLLIPWTLRWILYWKDVITDLLSPYKISFFPTMPVACLVLGSGAMLMKPFDGYQTFAWIMYVIGAFLVFGFACIMGYVMFTEDGVDLEHANYSWLIPPVGAIVVPMLGNVLVKSAGAYASLVAVINIAMWSIGFFLFIFFGNIIFFRMVKHSLPHAKVAPTVWISLGPIGVGTIGLMSMKASLGALGVSLNLAPASIFMWGFGLWSYVISVLVTYHYRKNTEIPYGLGWWAYTFPLGAYTISTIMLYKTFQISIFQWIAWLLYVTLIYFFIVVSYNTAKFILRG